MIAFILLLTVIALMFAMYISKKTENRRTERFDRLKERQQQLVESLKQTENLEEQSSGRTSE
jgi:Flp pilus assembly protein TadB